MGDYKDVLNNALARINTLEEEIAQCLQNSNQTFHIPKSPSKTDICRHWLKNQCSWKQKCRFSHGGASSTSSLSYFNDKDLEEVPQYAKAKMDKSVQVDFSLDIPSSSTSTCEIPLLSVTSCLPPLLFRLSSSNFVRLCRTFSSLCRTVQWCTWDQSLKQESAVYNVTSALSCL